MHTFTCRQRKHVIARHINCTWKHSTYLKISQRYTYMLSVGYLACKIPSYQSTNIRTKHSTHIRNFKHARTYRMVMIIERIHVRVNTPFPYTTIIPYIYDYHPIAVRFSQVYKNRADDDLIMRKRIQTIISNEISHYVNLINTSIIICSVIVWINMLQSRIT